MKQKALNKAIELNTKTLTIPLELNNTLVSKLFEDDNAEEGFGNIHNSTWKKEGQYGAFWVHKKPSAETI